MAKRLNVGVDVDGVVSDFLQAARGLCKQLFNGRPADSLIQTTWGLESMGITKEEEDKLWRTIDSIPNWWLGHKAMPETDLLPELNEKHRVIFITNRKDGTGWPIEDQTKHWIKQHFGIFNPTVIISNDKGPLVRGLNLDYFIDDRVKNVKEVSDYAKKYPRVGTQVFIQDFTNNREFGSDYVTRVKNFNEFAKIILEAA